MRIHEVVAIQRALRTGFTKADGFDTRRVPKFRRRAKSSSHRKRDPALVQLACPVCRPKKNKGNFSRAINSMTSSERHFLSYSLMLVGGAQSSSFVLSTHGAAHFGKLHQNTHHDSQL